MLAEAFSTVTSKTRRRGRPPHSEIQGLVDLTVLFGGFEPWLGHTKIISQTISYKAQYLTIDVDMAPPLLNLPRQGEDFTTMRWRVYHQWMIRITRWSETRDDEFTRNRQATLGMVILETFIG